MSENLEARIGRELTESMRAGDELRKRTLRALRAAIQNAELESVAQGRSKRGEKLDDEAILAVIQKQAKQRRDSIEQFEKGGREDLAAGERDELAVIETFLPRQLEESELEAIAAGVIAEVGASQPSDMGKVMGRMMQEVAGRADGKRVGAVVRRLLST